jgi:hypothetical protein
MVLALSGCETNEGDATRADCERTQAKALALLDDFARCAPGEVCRIWVAEPVRTPSGACVAALGCFAAIRSDSDSASLEARAREILGESRCRYGCAAVDCARPEQAEAYCDTATMRCKLRLLPNR